MFVYSKYNNYNSVCANSLKRKLSFRGRDRNTGIESLVTTTKKMRSENTERQITFCLMSMKLYRKDGVLKSSSHRYVFKLHAQLLNIKSSAHRCDIK